MNEIVAIVVTIALASGVGWLVKRVLDLKPKSGGIVPNKGFHPPHTKC